MVKHFYRISQKLQNDQLMKTLRMSKLQGLEVFSSESFLLFFSPHARTLRLLLLVITVAGCRL